MIHRALRVGRWTCDFLFVLGRNDTEGVMACLYEYDAPQDISRRAREIMEGGEPNCGFTFSNSDRRRSLSWIGPQSSGAQWINTAFHEIIHVAIAIAGAEGMEPFSEEFAYLCGDISQGIADLLCELACDRCRDKILESQGE